MTFRARILLTILAVVVATTAATLYVAQRQSSAGYQALVDELLRNQATSFLREQAQRHEQAARQVSVLAGSVRLFAALEAHDPQVYKVARDELRLEQFAFFRLLDAQGAVLPPPADGAAGALDMTSVSAPLAPESIRGRAAPEAVQLGFVEARAEGAAAPRLYRVLAAPVGNFGRQVGTLILGQQVMRFGDGPRESAGSPRLRSGLWLNGRLAGGEIPAAAREALPPLLRAPESANGGAEFRAGETTYRMHRALLNAGSAYPPAYLVSIFSMAGFEDQQRDVVWRTVLIGAIASAVAALLALATSRQLARPVADLVAATGEIRQGNYEARLAPSSIREMNTLADAFNAMAADLALKERYHSVLEQVADPQVAEELIAGRVKLGGELRDMTVMFCDIRDYTAFTVGRPPGVVIDLLNHHMGAMTEIVQAHGGVINQFAGDAIMALFGAPKRYGDDAERAVRCARAMIETRDRLNHSAEIPMRIGIGITSGPMVAGCIGAENRSDYTAVGERVNLAARLCASAGAGEVFIDDVTYQRVHDVFAGEPLPPLTLKGFREPVQALRVIIDEKVAV